MVLWTFLHFCSFFRALPMGLCMSQVTPKPVTYDLCCLEIKIIEIFSIEQSVLEPQNFSTIS